MAIVEDEVRNESEEENEIEVVVEEDDGDQDSDDSDDDEDEEMLEGKVAELERRISENPYNYDDHMELIEALWSLTELERWRSAFDRLHQMSLLHPAHWLLRLQTEITLSHSAASREYISKLFQEAAIDCYSIPILSEWCTWALSSAATGSAEAVSDARTELDEVLRRAGADPVSGMMFWDARLELENCRLEAMSSSDPGYSEQQERVWWALEEAASRPLLRGGAALPRLRERSGPRDLDKIEKQHEIAKEFLAKITPFEDKLLVVDVTEEKCIVYQEYIARVKELARDDKYAECDTDGILKVLYDRATTECLSSPAAFDLLMAWTKHATAVSSRDTRARVLHACTRRCPRKDTFWLLRMQHAEKEDKDFDEVKGILEEALSKGMETFKQAESLWLGYLEYGRRRADLQKTEDVDRLRRTFRLAWDSLAESWGEEANDSEVPLYWARLEYRRLGDARQGKDIFEEIFKYGENKTMSKYWEALITLESGRQPPLAEHKLRDLYRRALRNVADYPPAVARLWTDYERDYGHLATLTECQDACETKIKEWRESYQAMKDKMTGAKHKGKQQQNKKSKFDNKKKKKDDEKPNNSKRKLEGEHEGSGVKRKRDEGMEVEAAKDDSGGVKRPREMEDSESAVEQKRQRTESGSHDAAPERDACTLFVSNLDFKVDEQKLRSVLSKFGSVSSLRVRAGVKAFGGSICYCQYKTPDSVEEALKHDRMPLDGRPMFLSRYTAKKTKPTFKYSTTAEKNKLFVKNLPYEECTKEALSKVFDQYGKLRDVRIVTFKDGKPKGLAYIDYEDEESAATALEKTNGLVLAGRTLDVAFSAPPPRKDSAPEQVTLGIAKRDGGGGMRRTQLSSFIPSVLQKPTASTSQASTSNGTTNGDKRPMNNTDFRNMLLKK